MEIPEEARRALLQLLSAEKDDTHGGDKKKHTDDLKRQVEISEQRETHAGDIVEIGIGQNRLGAVEGRQS
jgi:hypothetical protein